MKILVVVDFDGRLVVAVRTTRSLRRGCITWKEVAILDEQLRDFRRGCMIPWQVTIIKIWREEMLYYVGKVARLHDKSLWTHFRVIWMIYRFEEIRLKQGTPESAVPLIMFVIILLQCKLFPRHLSFLWKRQRRVPLGLKSAQVENEAKSICLKSECTMEFWALSRYIHFLGSSLHLDSNVYFSVLGIFFIGLFLTSFFVPPMVNRYLKNFLLWHSLSYPF